MPDSRQLPDDLPVARTAIEPDEDATDALMRAARRAHIDLDADGRDPRLQEQVAADALDTLADYHRSHGDARDFVLLVDLWDRTFAVTPDAVEVFP